MGERLYKVPVITNDYNFLFRFAADTAADYLEILDYDEIADNFNLCYYDSDQAEESLKLLRMIAGR